MKNIIKSCSVFLLPLFFSCQQEDFRLENGGTIDIVIQDGVSGKTRSLPEPVSEEMAQQFSLRLRNEEKNWYKGTIQDYAASNTLFAPGSYEVSAWYGEDDELALDNPYYASEPLTVEVEANKETQATVKCYVANAMASFVFANSESATTLLKNYEIVTEVGSKTVSCTVDDGQNPYFKAGTAVTFYLRGESASGKNVDYKFAVIDKVEARMNYKFTLTLDPVDMGNGQFNIDVQKDVEEISINETLPEEFLPKPKVAIEGMESGNVLNHYETEPQPTLRCNLSAYRPLEDVELTLNFADENLQKLNKTYLFSEMTAEDKKELQDNGIALPELDGVQTSGSLDFSSLVANMHSQDNATPVQNQFTVRVKANGRWSALTEGNINILKPDFAVKVFPGDIWTKELTVTALRAEDVTHGDFNSLNSDLQYQFSTDGTQWENLGSDLRKASLTAGTEYYVRALYRNAISSQVQKVKTYEAKQIPNQTFDDGYDVTYPKNENPLYTFKGGWIETRNSMTCHTSGVNSFYVSKSGTLPVVDDGRNVAHMMTMGWGAGNTCSFGNKSGSVINNISAGLVCVGSFDASQDKITGLSAYVRPTALKFTYRAEPYNNDEYLIQISLENHDGAEPVVLGSGKLQSGEKVTSYKEQVLPVTYDNQYKDLPITHIKVEFYSGTKSDRDHLEDKFRDASVWDGYTNAYIIGSQFWLDGFSLVYDK